MDSLDNLLDDKIHVLKVIGQIPVYAKMNIATIEAISIDYRTSWLPNWFPDVIQGCKRTLQKNSRYESNRALKAIVNEIIILSNVLLKYLTDKDSESNLGKSDKGIYKKYCHKLIALSKEIDAGVIGLQNLIQTYATDPNTVANISVQIDKLIDQKNKINYELSTLTHIQSYCIPEKSISNLFGTNNTEYSEFNEYTDKPLHKLYKPID